MSYRKHLMTSDEPPSELYKATEVGTNLAEVGTDLISRKAAIDAIDECYCGGEDSCGEPWIYKENAVEAIQMIEPIQPAEPKRIRGHWIPVTNGRGGHECDLCHEYAPSFESGNEYLSRFCPNCGADMRGEKDG